MRLLFSLSSMETHVEMFAPIVSALQKISPALHCDVISLSEYWRRPSDISKLDRIFHQAFILQQHARILNAVAADATDRQLIPATRLAIEDILKKTKPACVVLANDRAFPAVDLIRIAKAAGIPSLLVQESIRKDEVMPQRNGLLMNGQGGCDRIAAWGEISRDYYRRVGVEADRIRLTGAPRIDEFIADTKQLDQKTVRNTFNICAATGHMILLATNPLPPMGILPKEQYVSTIQTIIDVSAKTNIPTQLVIKPHQIERALFSRWGLEKAWEDIHHIFYLPNITLPEAVVAADAVLVFNSTVALEAALIKKPVGIVNLFDVKFGMDFSQYDFAEKLDSVEKLSNFLQRAPRQHSKTSYDIQRFVVHLGLAADNIAAEILDLCKDRLTKEMSI